MSDWTAAVALNVVAADTSRKVCPGVGVGVLGGAAEPIVLSPPPPHAASDISGSESNKDRTRIENPLCPLIGPSFDDVR